MIDEGMEKTDDGSLYGMVENAVGMVSRNPEVLLMYLPLGGWGYVLWKGFRG